MQKLRLEGECQLCEGTFKVRYGGMVHHGYRRPGDGAIHGDCPGVKAAPYEVACDLLVLYRERMLSKREGLLERLEAVKAGKALHFTRLERVRGTYGRQYELLDYAVGVTDRFVFECHLATLARELESDARHCEREAERARRRIDGWRPKPLREVAV